MNVVRIIKHNHLTKIALSPQAHLLGTIPSMLIVSHAQLQASAARLAARLAGKLGRELAAEGAGRCELVNFESKEFKRIFCWQRLQNSRSAGGARPLGLRSQRDGHVVLPVRAVCIAG